MVSLAFTKVLTGERRWQADKEPDLKKYLMSVIDSLLNHLAEHSDNRMLRAMPDEGQAATTPTTSARNPEMALLQEEKKRHEARVMQLLIEVSQDDPLVLRMIQSMQGGCEKPGDIATTLGIPVSDVYNAMKRLERKIVRVRQRLQAPLGEGDYGRTQARHR
jgi:DNA-directed RNA polymerase specialized sigma24 family protein